MLIAFELSMPSNNAWNGKWTGEKNYYALVRNIPKDKVSEILSKERYSYSFGDGWVAKISVRHVKAKEAAVIRRKSRGFCGYDWMVSSIVDRGCIETT